MAGRTGLEPAASCVTGRRSNQLNYHPTEPTALSRLFNVRDAPVRRIAIIATAGHCSANASQPLLLRDRQAF